MMPRADLAGVVGLALALLTVPATGAPSRAELEERIQRLEAAAQQDDGRALLELSRQLDALSVELRSLRGQVEELRQQLARHSSSQRNQYLDLDGRLAELERKAVQPVTEGGVSSDPDGDYRRALDALKAGEFPEARAALDGFLSRHPDHELAGNARYWLGEVHYAERDFAGALAIFLQVAADNSAQKAPDALLKAGFCQYELKRDEDARRTLTRIGQLHPDTPAAAEAVRRLERMRAEGR